MSLPCLATPGPATLPAEPIPARHLPSRLLTARQRLGAPADQVRWVVADLLTWQPARTYRIWHDRAVFHFLTTADDQRRYLHALTAATTAGSVAIVGCFAPDAPAQCSGLPTARYDADELSAVLGPDWSRVADDHEDHRTPAGVIQPLTWATYRRQDRRRAPARRRPARSFRCSQDSGLGTCSAVRA